MKHEQPLEPVEFTQFMLPDGRRHKTFIARPKAIAEKVREICRSGGRLEIERLSNGVISMEIVRGEDSLSIKLCPNDPSVPRVVDELVNEAHRALFSDIQ